MQTINGKLITEEKQQLDNLKHHATNLMQTYQELEVQLAEIQQHNVKYLEEINTIKNHLSKLDKRCILLEESITRQLIQFVVLNICAVFGLFGLWVWFSNNNKPVSISANQTINCHSERSKESLLYSSFFKMLPCGKTALTYLSMT